MFADWSFGEREEQSFVYWRGGALRGGIEFANGVGFVAEELDAEGTVGLGGVDIEDAAAGGVLAGHFDHVGGGVADGVEMRQQRFEIERLAAADGSGKVGIIVGGAQADGRGCDGRDHDGGGSGCDLPESGGAFFLEFRMRGEILEREDVAGGESDDRIGIAGGGEFTEAAKDRKVVLGGAIVVDDKDERTGGGALKQHEEQGFCSGSEPGDTNTPRALLEVGGYTHEGGKLFYVREEFADEG